MQNCLHVVLRSVPASSDCIATVGHVAIINTMLLIVFDTKVLVCGYVTVTVQIHSVPFHIVGIHLFLLTCVITVNTSILRMATVNSVTVIRATDQSALSSCATDIIKKN